MRRKPELMQLDIGMSTMRDLPPSGTAGLARSLVNGKSREPWPPPMITQSTLLVLVDWRPVRDIDALSVWVASLAHLYPRRRGGCKWQPVDGSTFSNATELSSVHVHFAFNR